MNRLISWRSTASGQDVALTFDDGPDAEFTPRVLDILERHGAVATFFVLGHNAERHPDIVHQIAASGHEIGIHGYDHTIEDLPAQTERTQAILRKLGVNTRIFRPPGGYLGPKTQMWMARNGFPTVLWSFDLHDSMRHEGKVHTCAPFSEIGAGDVVLMHDDNPVCTDELPELLESIHERGLRTVTLSGLFGYRQAAA